MKVCNNLAELESYIRSQLQDCLYNEIGDEIDHVIQKHVQSDVYDAYDPLIYERRGLLKSAQYLYHIPNGLTLEVVDQTPGDTPIMPGYSAPTSTQLSEIISGGLQGNRYGKWRLAFPRPYMQNAEDEVQQKVVEILQRRFG